ncbi:hypothetical protein EJB05_11765 [Eragrostis curvula]|uniref:Protein kinase domain-containing protein n=1 Tax=Eragrostis curvula TaxID=38414 RepID=A0A5J9VS79_9POAL|nr:hypothetical protein EJB05_11765 [Eragrostis curvula]
MLVAMSKSKPVRALRMLPPPLIAFAVISLLLSALPLCQPYTYEQDVFAINGLYTALGSPGLPNWITNGGDPCNENWQGVECVNSNITSITLSGANLGGQLGNTLANFTSLITLDLSNNNIGGTIPDGLPVTMQKLFLSANQLSGSIPSTLSTLTQLTTVSLNNNHLVGEIPDVFAALTGVANLDFSSNNLTGPLPPSMGNLTALASLHIQNNQISGILDVLQDLPLQDLNIENNLFSGPVPVKLLNLPNFKKDGNPFNTSIAPSAQPPAALAPLAPPSTGHVPSKEPAHSSNGTGGSNPAPPSGTNKVSIVKLVGYILIGVVSAVVVVLLALYCLSKYKERKSRDDIYTKGQMGKAPQKLGEPKIKEVKEIKEPSIKLKNNVGKASNVTCDAKEVEKLNIPAAGSNVVCDAQDGRKLDSSVTVKQKEHVIDMESVDSFVEEQRPTQPAQRTEKAVVNASVRTRRGRVPSVGKATTVKSFSIASLQQYTNSFGEDNFIRDSRFGKVYLAELPDGELLEVLKIDTLKIPADAFLELVVTISELRHPNILELVGYCAEFEQRLLVYEHCSKMTLHDELHFVDDLNKPLSWNARLQVAVGAAKALQHLHDGCQPPIVHQNFEPSVVLLNSTLVVHISECGLAALTSNSSSQTIISLPCLSRCSRPRNEQHLVRWATSQLYDIDAISKMVDPFIQGQCSEKALSRFADIISRCIQHEPEFRPPMSEVVQDLSRMLNNATKASM